MYIFAIKNTFKLLLKTFYHKCDAYNFDSKKDKDKIDLPYDELLIQVFQFPGPELEFHFQQSSCEALSTDVIRD